MGFFIGIKECVMTYLEKILYLSGKYISQCQFVVKTAYRLSFLNQTKKEGYISSLDALEVKESQALSQLREHMHYSGEEHITYLQDKGFSIKDFALLKKVLLRRDYLISTYYMDNSEALGREEVAIYESKIKELEEYCQDCDKLNVELNKLCDRFYSL